MASAGRLSPSRSTNPEIWESPPHVHFLISSRGIWGSGEEQAGGGWVYASYLISRGESLGGLWFMP